MCVKISNVKKLNAGLKLSTACLALALLMPVNAEAAGDSMEEIAQIKNEIRPKFPRKLHKIIFKGATYSAEEAKLELRGVDLHGTTGHPKKEVKKSKGPKIKTWDEDGHRIKKNTKLRDEEYKIVSELQDRVFHMDLQKFRASQTQLINLSSNYLNNNTNKPIHRDHLLAKERSDDVVNQTKTTLSGETSGDIHVEGGGPGGGGGGRLGAKGAASWENTKTHEQKNNQHEEVKDTIEVAQLSQENTIRAGQRGQYLTPFIDRNGYTGVVRLIVSVPKNRFHINYTGEQKISHKVTYYLKKYYEYKNEKGKSLNNFLFIDEDEPTGEYKKLLKARLEAKITDPKAYDENEYSDLSFYTLMADAYFEKNKAEYAEKENKLYYCVVNIKRNTIYFMHYGMSVASDVRNGVSYEDK